MDNPLVLTALKTAPARAFTVRMKAACLAAAGIALAATGAHAETLADAIAIAYAHNPTLVQQRYTQRATDENYTQVRSQYGPQLSVQVTGQYQRVDQPNSFTGVRGVTTANAGEAVGTISQPLYTSGRLRGQLASAKASVLAGQQTLRQVEQQVLQNVIIVYASVLRDQQRLEVARQNVEVLQDQLRQNTALYSAPSKRQGSQPGAGDVTLTDIGLADSRLANAEISLATIEATLANSRGEYLQVVGQNPGTLAPLPDLANMPGSIDEAFAQAEANNPGLLSAKYTEQSSSANAASVRGSRGPQVSLTAQGIYQNQLSPFSGQRGTNEFVGGVTITQPFFTSGQLQSQVRQADARNGADQAAVEAARRDAVQSVTSAWSQLVAARQGLISGARQVHSAQVSFAGMRLEERDGYRSVLDTLQVEQELVNAQLTFLTNQYTEFVSRAALLAAIGALKPEAITPGLDTYDANKNFERVRNKGQLPIEYIARAVDRIGSADPRRPVIADLKGEDSPLPDAMPALPPTPGPDLMQKKLVPVTESPVVPAATLPNGLPPLGAMPDKPSLPPLEHLP